MATILTLVVKDLRRRIAAPFELAIMLAIPLVLAGLMALAFGNIGGGSGDTTATMPKLKIVLVDLDDTLLTRFLAGATQSPEMAERVDVTRETTRESGLERLYDEKATALLILPQGLTDALTGGPPAELELIKNPSQSILPGVAEQGAEIAAFYLSLVARGIGDEASAVRRLLGAETLPDLAELGGLLNRLRVKIEGSAGELFPPILSIQLREAAHEEGADEGPTGIGRMMAVMFPGLMVMGLLFLGNAQMKDILHERRQGTLRRQIATPAAVGQILVAKMIAAGVVVAVGLAALLAVGTLAFDVTWRPLGMVVVGCVILIVFVVGFSALLHSVLRTERQADAAGSIVVMILAFLGGAIMPINDPPAWLALVSRASPIFWGAQALRSLAGVESSIPLGQSLAVLASISVVLVLAGTMALRLRHMRGAL